MPTVGTVLNERQTLPSVQYALEFISEAIFTVKGSSSIELLTLKAVEKHL